MHYAIYFQIPMRHNPARSPHTSPHEASTITPLLSSAPRRASGYNITPRDSTSFKPDKCCREVGVGAARSEGEGDKRDVKNQSYNVILRCSAFRKMSFIYIFR